MSLSELSDWIRSALKWVIICILIIISIWFVWLVVVSLWGNYQNSNQTQAKYGKLSPPIFVETYFNFIPGKITEKIDINYKKNSAGVFKINQARDFSESQIENITVLFGFSKSTKTTEQGVVTYKRNQKILKINTYKKSFTYQNNPNLSKNNSSVSSDEKNLVKNSINIVKKLKFDHEDINFNNPQIEYYFYDDGKIEETATKNSNAVGINFYRKIKDFMSSGDSLIKIVYLKDGKTLVRFDYYYYPIDRSGSNYPVISASTALKELGSGHSFIKKPIEKRNLTVTNMELTYWESNFSQLYLQPVWKLLGKISSKVTENEIELFIPAIDPKYLSGFELNEVSAPNPPLQ